MFTKQKYFFPVLRILVTAKVFEMVYTVDLYNATPIREYHIHLVNYVEHEEDYYDNLYERHYILNHKFYNTISHHVFDDNVLNGNDLRFQNVVIVVDF